jgi:hypothetical protein
MSLEGALPLGSITGLYVAGRASLGKLCLLTAPLTLQSEAAFMVVCRWTHAAVLPLFQLSYLVAVCRFGFVPRR